MPEGAADDAPIPLASALAGGPTAFVRADVALDGEPVIGSFTVDGMTFAVADGGTVELVGVSPGEGSDALAIPASISFEGVDYAVSVIGAYAFYLSAIASVELPASVGNVDERAFRSSDVASVEVDPANPSYASFDGILYDASFSRLLLIPGGRMGAARISDKAEEVGARAFSHCAGVTAISVDAGSAFLSSWDGLLYDADGSTLLRVPAGATDITIRDGCTAIAAGAMEGCAQLSAITAPASVTSISPDVFTSVPTVSLPAASAVSDGLGASTGAAEKPSEQASPALASGSASAQLSALVALSANEGDLPEVDPADISVVLSGASAGLWTERGFFVDDEQAYSSIGPSVSQPDLPMAAIDKYDASKAPTYYTVTVYPNGHTLKATDKVWSTSGQYLYATLRTYTFSGSQTVSDAWTRSFHTAFDHVNLEFWDRYYESNTDLWQFTEITNGTVGWSLRGFARTPNGAALNAGAGNVWFEETTSLFALWRAHTYVVRYNANGGMGTMGDSSHVYDTGQSLASNVFWRPGYTFAGWGTSSGGPVVYGDSAWVINLTAADGGIVNLYAQWRANPITLTWNSQGGSSVANTSATYSSSAKVPMPASNPTRAGYTFAGWWTAASGGTQVTSSTALPTANATYHAHWSLNPYSITYELDGGSVSGNPTTYNAETASFTLKNPTRTGYTFAGWSGTGLSGSANKTVTIAKGSTGDRAYTAHWTPAISADVPLEVTARVDVLGLEEQEEATGYIESRCGEPLTVASIELTPLAAATEIFGAANVADVALEVLAAGSVSPDARFALDASASQTPASAAAFRMASYGTRVPIGYRFAIPDALLPTLTEATKPVCSVTYTMALANPES